MCLMCRSNVSNLSNVSQNREQGRHADNMAYLNVVLSVDVVVLHFGNFVISLCESLAQIIQLWEERVLGVRVYTWLMLFATCTPNTLGNHME